MAESAGSRFGGLDAGSGAGGLPIRDRQVLTPKRSRALVNTSPSVSPGPLPTNAGGAGRNSRGLRPQVTGHHGLPTAEPVLGTLGCRSLWDTLVRFQD